MTRFVAILTSFALLVHVLGGCCGHHGHAVETESTAGKAASSPDALTFGGTVDHCGCGHGHHEDDSREGGPHSTPPEDCDTSTCVVVSVSSVAMPSPLSHALPAWLDLASNPAGQLVKSYSPEGSEPWLGPPLTLFDLHQILLV